MRWSTVIYMSMFVSGVAAAQPGDRDWGQTLRADATFLRDELIANHPGYVDPLNPGFRSLVRRGYALARSRAETARSFTDYWWALREYTASFDDGHLQVGFTEASPDYSRSWPGFLTRYQNDRHVVASRLPDATLPPLGAELVSCDGRDAARLAAENVGRFWGRWTLTSRRETDGWRLFLDEQNPYVRRPSVCNFRVEGQERSYALSWRADPDGEIQAHIRRASEVFRAPVQARWFGDNGYWVSFGTFGSGAPQEAAKLPQLTQRIERERERIRQADIIVFDLRGNVGGSSNWSYAIASSLWGQRWSETKRPHLGDIDWRASPAVIRQFEADLEYWREQNNPGMMEWTRNGIAALRAAHAAGRPFWRQVNPRPSVDPEARPETRAKIFVLTDGTCLSACLDALDLWKPLGAIHVGRETSADTFYIQVRRPVAPSGMTVFLMPQKVWRNRPRGSNEPHRPLHRFTGNMSDTTALEEWIRGLTVPTEIPATPQ